MKTKVAVKHSKLFLFVVFSLVTVIAIVGGFVIAANEYNVHVELNNKDVARTLKRSFIFLFFYIFDFFAKNI